MSSRRIVLKKETRVLGAAQVMTGLIHGALGYIWTCLYIWEKKAFSSVYLPIALLSGYPFIASLFYVISGTFAIKAEKTRSSILLKYTIKVNTLSFALAVIGLILIITEIILFLVKSVKSHWPHKIGINLSMDLGIFSTLELFLANTVAKWGIRAFCRSNYPTFMIPEGPFLTY